MPRYALRVFYDGSNFFGSQRQPGQRTVEGELLKAFEALDLRYQNFQSAGRTDAGVSALGNVFAVTTSRKLSPRMLNSALPKDIRVLAAREVHENFNPRKEARERIYRYFLYDEGHDIKKLRSAAKLFEGEHDFRSFALLEGEKNPVRRIKKITVKRKENFLIVTFRGESFLRQMVRRIVTALKMAGKGEIAMRELKKCLTGKCSKTFPPAVSENLVLWDVRYGFEFEHEDYSARSFLRQILARKQSAERKVLVWEEILKKFSKLAAHKHG